MAEPTAPTVHYEHKFPVLLAILGAFALYLLLPESISLFPRWVVPIAGVFVLLPLIIMNPRRVSRETTWSRWLGIGFALALAAVNQYYVVVIVMQLVNGLIDGPSILLTAFAVWITNVIAFSLVYWELDKGGPYARRIEGVRDDAPQDFQFPQQQNDTRWDPVFFDYAYFSLSNMMAFSPTDTMPLTLRAKGLMAYQALTGFVLLALVISRAVNILT
ncbi:MAG: DUF1345 domain-containing protein [Actinobacteria bacterium]|nr:DUF1345 domain-containing protein [Actinomycetota bacterium]